MRKKFKKLVGFTTAVAMAVSLVPKKFLQKNQKWQ